MSLGATLLYTTFYRDSRAIGSSFSGERTAGLRDIENSILVSLGNHTSLDKVCAVIGGEYRGADGTQDQEKRNCA